MTRVAIHQPNYAPWCGYFAKMAQADQFVFLDDVQMPGGSSYVHRTRVRSEGGGGWLSIPVRRNFGQLISSVTMADPDWPAGHLRKLWHIYRGCPHYQAVLARLEPVYLAGDTHLASFNIRMIQAIAAILELEAAFVLSSELAVPGTGDDRLIALVRGLGGDTYLSGKGGANYQDPEKFAGAGIELRVNIYQPPEYPQIQGAFVGGLSILDALFHLGPAARSLLRYG